MRVPDFPLFYPFSSKRSCPLIGVLTVFKFHTNLLDKQITPLAENQVCYSTDDNDVFVNDVCSDPDVCWLNGCGDIVMGIIKSYVAPVLGIVFLLSVFAYFYGVVYTFWLTIAVSDFQYSKGALQYFVMPIN